MYKQITDGKACDQLEMLGFLAGSQNTWEQSPQRGLLIGCVISSSKVCASAFSHNIYSNFKVKLKESTEILSRTSPGFKFNRYKMFCFFFFFKQFSLA